MGAKLRSRDGATAAVRNPNKVRFVKNEEFMPPLIERQQINKKRLEEGLEPIPVSDYLAKQIWMIADAESKGYRFIGYTYREDMVVEAAMQCIRYIDSWSPEKGNNPFGYFKQICYFKMVEFINKQKDEEYVKYKILNNLGTMLDDITVDCHDMDEDFKNHITELKQLQGNSSIEETFAKRAIREKELKEKREAALGIVEEHVISIDDFCEDVDENCNNQ